MTFLRVENVRKSIPGRDILRNVSFEVGRGEIFGLVGPSGAGKTSLIRIINLLDMPSAGRVVIDGINPNSELNQRLGFIRKMGTVFQNPVMLNSNVFDNIAYALHIRGVEKNVIVERVKKTLALLGLAGFEDRNARSLSGGEAQRVALGRVLVYEPDLLLLDEATANLDPANVSIIENVISKINQEKDITIVMTTHNMFQAKRLAKRVGLLLDGELVEVAEASKFFNEPSDRRTRAFTRGEMIY